MELVRTAITAAYSSQIQNLYNVFARNLRDAAGDSAKEQKARDRFANALNKAKKAFDEAMAIAS